MAGMQPFTTFDELWHNVPVDDQATVLASAFSSLDSGGSGRYEPVAMVKEFGKGRSFTLMLGHDTRAMDNLGFQSLLARGSEWAATGNVTLPLPGNWPSINKEDLPLVDEPYRFHSKNGTFGLRDDKNRLAIQLRHQ